MVGGNGRVSRVSIAGRSWKGAEPGRYCFEATIDGQSAELRVSEEVAFDLLNAWTRSSTTCLHILGLHRAELARSLDRKIRGGFKSAGDGIYSLTLRDVSVAAECPDDRRRPHPA